ncbi:MAG: hypothetical protein IIA90_00495, partial [Chloroflexi bacterium]|nr:hypothetical protein [Chloroflexota bacterium]
VMGLSSAGVTVALPPDATSSGLAFGVLNNGSGLLGFQVLTDASWLKAATPAGVALGDDLGGIDGTVQLTVNTAGLAPGQHIGRATVNSLYPAGSPHTFVVDLLVTAGGLTPTATPTPTPTPTLAATPVSLAAIWADGNCSGSVDPIDALVTMRHDAGFDTLTAECPGMGWTVQLVGGSQHTWGDVDCSGEVNPIDALKILRFDVGLSLSQEADCPGMGAAVLIANG